MKRDHQMVHNKGMQQMKEFRAGAPIGQIDVFDLTRHARPQHPDSQVHPRNKSSNFASGGPMKIKQTSKSRPCDSLAVTLLLLPMSTSEAQLHATNMPKSKTD